MRALACLFAASCMATPARGGSIDVGGPAIANGVVLTTSGYAQWGGLNGRFQVMAYGQRYRLTCVRYAL